MQKRIRAEAPNAVNRRFGSFPAPKSIQARLGIKNLLAHSAMKMSLMHEENHHHDHKIIYFTDLLKNGEDSLHIHHAGRVRLPR